MWRDKQSEVDIVKFSYPVTINSLQWSQFILFYKALIKIEYLIIGIHLQVYFWLPHCDTYLQQKTYYWQPY